MGNWIIHNLVPPGLLSCTMCIVCMIHGSWRSSSPFHWLNNEIYIYFTSLKPWLSSGSDESEWLMCYTNLKWHIISILIRKFTKNKKNSFSHSIERNWSSLMISILLIMKMEKKMSGSPESMVTTLQILFIHSFIADVIHHLLFSHIKRM